MNVDENGLIIKPAKVANDAVHVAPLQGQVPAAGNVAASLWWAVFWRGLFLAVVMGMLMGALFGALREVTGNREPDWLFMTASFGSYVVAQILATLWVLRRGFGGGRRVIVMERMTHAG